MDSIKSASWGGVVGAGHFTRLFPSQNLILQNQQNQSLLNLREGRDGREREKPPTERGPASHSDFGASVPG
jgi:hypothetical protein